MKNQFTNICHECNIQKKKIGLNVYIRKGRSKINNLSFHVRQLLREEQFKPMEEEKK